MHIAQAASAPVPIAAAKLTAEVETALGSLLRTIGRRCTTLRRSPIDAVTGLTLRALDAAFACTLAGLLAVPAAADEPPRLGEAITRGTLSLDLRYRYEEVDQESLAESGRASTLRSTLAYRTLAWHGFAAFAEFEDVRDLGLAGDHNNGGAGSLANGVSDRPLIADPELTELNQAYLDWQPGAGLLLRGGRQEIVVDNARFIGNVAWRQNHQSLDGAVLRWAGIEDLALSAIWIARQRTVTGASRPMTGGHLDASYTFSSAAVARAYLLELDFDDEPQWGLSTRTLGAALAGTWKLGEGRGLRYRLEAAEQRDTGDNPSQVEAGYRRVDLGLVVGALAFDAGYELLGDSAAGGAFQTPLATLHAFNGWADIFTTTPGEGLRDLWLGGSATLGAWRLLAAYHDFAADAGGADYGGELDASVVFTAPWKQKFAVELALYDAVSFGTDTDKIFVWTQWGF